MKVVQVDKRHALHFRGFKVFLQLNQKENMHTYRQIMEPIHGASSDYDFASGRWVRNENWCFDAKRKRIWLRNEQDVTLLLLKMQHKNG